MAETKERWERERDGRMETISAPCNIHHGTASLPGGRRVWDIGGRKEGVKEERVAMLLVLPVATVSSRAATAPPARSKERKESGKWPQGALLGTSRRSVAGPEGFWDSIKLDNAIMPAEQPSSFCHGRYVKNSSAGSTERAAVQIHLEHTGKQGS
ncbi:hypothetical protein HZH68_006360 [Vespula germanica]|uniref:Uncharacterized protein n=1 Tax=Vespula germanica TaxID=30212 RepID=A0A834KBA0_VESGE|nr:hypothetical protein HZH68_006360 [Vespula germanica]